MDLGNSRIQAFEKNGRLRTTWGQWGSFPGLLDGPSGIAWAGGCVFVAEHNNHRIQRFDPDGAALGQWGLHAMRPREGQGKLHYPYDVTLNNDATTAVVCEAFEDRVQVFKWGAPGEERLQPDARLLGASVAPHYGRRLDTALDLLVLLEPVTHSILVFDFDADEPITLEGFTIKNGAAGVVGGAIRLS